MLDLHIPPGRSIWVTFTFNGQPIRASLHAIQEVDGEPHAFGFVGRQLCRWPVSEMVGLVRELSYAELVAAGTAGGR